MDDLVQEYPGLLSADTSSLNRGGNVRWAAPELLGGGAHHEVTYKLTPRTDIYSFGMTVIEVRGSLGTSWAGNLILIFF